MVQFSDSNNNNSNNVYRLGLISFKFKSSEFGVSLLSPAVHEQTTQTRAGVGLTIATQSRTWLVETKAFCANLLTPLPYTAMEVYPTLL